MERVKNILQRLQEVYYSKHQKSAIDIDLMMDYTRVMYADLMEWRTQFKDPITSETAEKNTEIITSEAEKEEAMQPRSVVAAAESQLTAEPQPEVVEEPEPEPEPEAVAEPEEVQEEEIAVAETNSNVVPEDNVPEDNASARQEIERDEPLVKEPAIETEPLIATYPDKEQVEILMSDATGISFEPPAQHEVKSEVKDEVLVEEEPAVNQPVEEIPAPAPAEIPLPDMESLKKPETQASKPMDLFHAAKAANRDVRSSIGINDKYLFLNELFNNHKSNYEETLDKLNHFSTLEQAEDWILTKVAPVQKWDKDDATVQGFYAMLSKHFSAR